jgi:hypothetical protein
VSDGVDGPDPSGWARLPRWQHVALMVLCSFALVAAVVNMAATSGGNRFIHLFIGVLVAVVLLTLVRAYGQRR